MYQDVLIVRPFHVSDADYNIPRSEDSPEARYKRRRDDELAAQKEGDEKIAYYKKEQLSQKSSNPLMPYNVNGVNAVPWKRRALAEKLRKQQNKLDLKAVIEENERSGAVVGDVILVSATCATAVILQKYLKQAELVTDLTPNGGMVQVPLVKWASATKRIKLLTTTDPLFESDIKEFPDNTVSWLDLNGKLIEILAGPHWRPDGVFVAEDVFLTPVVANPEGATNKHALRRVSANEVYLEMNTREIENLRRSVDAGNYPYIASKDTV